MSFAISFCCAFFAVFYCYFMLSKFLDIIVQINLKSTEEAAHNEVLKFGNFSVENVVTKGFVKFATLGGCELGFLRRFDVTLIEDHRGVDRF